MTPIKTCLVIGDPVAHSLSPIMHTAGYAALGIEGEFCFRAERVTAAELSAALIKFEHEGVRGISCTMPHKESLLSLLSNIDPVARTIGAVNTLVNRNGKFVGMNTDWIGIVRPLEERRSLNAANVAVFGAGGASRAALFGLRRGGANVTVFNRTRDRAVLLAQEFNATAVAFDEITSLASFDILINASALGMGPLSGESPIRAELICKDHLIFDTVYHPRETRLLNEARGRGATTISGTEMLLHQGAAQFTLYTGREAPVEAMRKALESTLEQRATKV